MSDIITQTTIPVTAPAITPAITRAFTSTSAEPLINPGDAWPSHLERRRPGRNDDVNPALVALMRKPTTEARLRVMLYDAPNFVLPAAGTHRGGPVHALRMTIAVVSCGLVWALAFRGMMLLWG